MSIEERNPDTTVCAWCNDKLPDDLDPGEEFCSEDCRQAFYRKLEEFEERKI